MRHLTTTGEKKTRTNIVRSWCGLWVRKHAAITRMAIAADLYHGDICDGCIKCER